MTKDNKLTNLSLIYTALDGRLECVKKFINDAKDDGKDVNAKTAEPFLISNQTALHFASEGGNLEVVYFLLMEGADVSAIDDEGSTALHYASLQGHVEVAKLLLEWNVDADVRNKDGHTTLSLAKKHSNKEFVKLLEHLTIYSRLNIPSTGIIVKSGL